MPYILREGSPLGEVGLLYVEGPDNLSCQAEILYTFREGLKKSSCPTGRILGHYTVNPKLSYSNWLSKFREVDRVAIVALAADITAKGWDSFHSGKAPIPAPSSMVTTLTSQSTLGTVTKEIAAEAAMALQSKKFDGTSSEAAALADAFANPLHAGIHPDFKAGLPEEVWVQTALGAIKSWGPEKWIRRMITCLRNVFGGRAKDPVPHKNDFCPCKSTKKYGKCCGIGVEEGDPEDCKLGRHDFKEPWEADHTGKFIRGCSNCLKIEEAPYGEEVGIPSCPKILLIGCKTCHAAPSTEEAEKLVIAWQAWYRCGSCNAPFTIREAHVEHFLKTDYTHESLWKITFLVGSPDIVEITFPGDTQRMVSVHHDCLKRAIPHFDALAKPVKTGMEGSVFKTASGSYSKANKDFIINGTPEKSTLREFTH